MASLSLHDPNITLRGLLVGRFFLDCLEAQLGYKVVLISAAQQSEVNDTHTDTLFHYGLAQVIESINRPWALQPGLLLTHPAHTHLHLLVPNSQSLPPPRPPPWQAPVCSLRSGPVSAL